MSKISPEELVELGSKFGLEVTKEEAKALCEEVNGMFEELDRVYEIETPTDLHNSYRRHWDHPVDDPHNAICVRCDILPEADHSGILTGIQVGVKDNIAVACVPMSCGSDLMRDFVPRTDATVVRRLRDNGGTIAAKTNLDEMAASAWGSSSKDQITNPYDNNRVAGGSSGGSAVAVATGKVDVALGTDTGGSVRIPAAFCNVVGLKPTYGLISQNGVVENTYTQDHVGIITSTVLEAAQVLEAVNGADPADPASLAAASRDGYQKGGLY